MAKFKRTTIFNKFKTIGCALILPLCATGVGVITTPTAHTEAADFLSFYSQNVDINNGSFQNGGGDFSSGYSLSGWEAVDRNSKALGMIINVGPSFGDYNSQYKLNVNPRDTGKDDDRILMINSRSDDNAENVFLKQGYQLANNITLEANSYYSLTVCAKASLDDRADGVDSARASIYLEGLKDPQGKDVEVYYENIDESSWQVYSFFIATGTQSQSINLGLYLGSKTLGSTGVAFFDEVNLTRFAERSFYETLDQKNYGYAGNDVKTEQNFVNGRVNTRFVIDCLKERDNAVVDTSKLNFDFEDGLDEHTLGDKWKLVYSQNNSHAVIMQVGDINNDYFKRETGYEFVGADFSYKYDKKQGIKQQNQNALVLYNNEKSFVTVQSGDIVLPAHAIYKISLRAKISSLEGNFKVGLVETENSNFVLPSSYTLSSFSKNGFTNNGDDKFHNDYTNIDLYVKGHDLYDTQFAIQLSLGTQDENAKGCVLFDNIVVTRVDYSAYNAASSGDKTEFKVDTNNPSFTNGNFDFAENQNFNLEYPLAAQGFTATKTDYSESGIVYVPYDEKHYDELYKPSYDEHGNLLKGFDWYIASFGHPKGYKTTNNNVYMMYNSILTAQSLATPTFTAGSGITQISFDLKTISTISKQASIAIEITDENGIVLYYKDGISAQDWASQKLYIKGGESISSTLTLKIHFGQQKTDNYNENLMKGYVLLDNFETNSLSALPEGFAAAVDLSDFYLNLDPFGKVGGNITNSTAFTFESENLLPSSVGEPAHGGVVSGKANEYNVESKNNILVISASGPSKNTLTSKYKFSFSGSSDTASYYKLTFDLRTLFSYEQLEDSKEHKCSSGVSVGLDGFEKVTALRSDKDFTTYTIYFKSTASATPALVFALDCDCDNTCGNAYLTNVLFTTATEADYNAALEINSENKTTFTSTATTDQDSDDQNTTPEESSSPINTEELWVIIPSIIMALTVIIAIIAFALRKVKFKKIEKARRESYDRVAYVNHDIMLKRAQEERDKEAEEIRSALKAIAEERQAIESEHKEAVKASRASGGKVTKATERQFKLYAQQIARLSEKEEILREELETTMSADYLISVERKLADEEEKMLKEMAKQKPIKDERPANEEQNDNKKK